MKFFWRYMYIDIWHIICHLGVKICFLKMKGNGLIYIFMTNLLGFLTTLLTFSNNSHLTSCWEINKKILCQWTEKLKVVQIRTWLYNFLIIIYKLISPSNKPQKEYWIFLKWWPTSNILIERYCLGYVINRHNRHKRWHRLDWKVSKMKKEKHSKISCSLYILGIPLNNSLICSSWCVFSSDITWP